MINKINIFIARIKGTPYNAAYWSRFKNSYLIDFSFEEIAFITYWLAALLLLTYNYLTI